MNHRKSVRRKKKNNGFFKGYRLRGDYFGRKLIALVSLSVLVMAAGVFAFAEFGEDGGDSNNTCACGPGCECLKFDADCYCVGCGGCGECGDCGSINTGDCCGNECSGCTDCSCENDGDCSVGVCESCGSDCAGCDGECGSCNSECDTDENCCAEDETDCGYGENCSCGLGDDCNCVDDGSGGSNCACGGYCDCPEQGDQCNCVEPPTEINMCQCNGTICENPLACPHCSIGNFDDCPCVPTECYWLDSSCRCVEFGRNPDNCTYCAESSSSCPCAPQDEPPGQEEPASERFTFQVRTTSANQIFYIPLGGVSGAAPRPYDWKIEWTDSDGNTGIRYESGTQNATNIGSSNNYGGGGSINISFANPGIHTITITPNGSLDRWFAAFGFNGSDADSSAGAGTQRNRNLLVALLTPITPLMTRNAADFETAIVDNEWRNAFVQCNNLIMGSDFTFDKAAWSNVSAVGDNFANKMFYKIIGDNFTMGESFNLPQGFISVGDRFAEEMFSDVRSATFNMNDIFTLPPQITGVGTFFGAYMFNGLVFCDQFTMGEEFNIPQGITSVGNNFADSMFRSCSGNAFTMNEKFNLPQGLESVGNYFARYMFRSNSGDSFNMNDEFNLPQGLVSVGNGFAQEMFYASYGNAFTMNDRFNLPPAIVSAGSSFVQGMFSTCRGRAFNMNDVFTFPQGITIANTRFAYEMFSGCRGMSFTMGKEFTLPPYITSVGDDFAYNMFTYCYGEAFTMNEVFNLPQGLESVGNNFARSMFDTSYGNAFTMNDIFNLPPGIIDHGTNFAYSMFARSRGNALTMNDVFNLPQGIIIASDGFAQHMFLGCWGSAFTMNDVFNLPQGIETTGNEFARNMFDSCYGNAFTMNDSFNFPINITSIGSDFAFNMFTGCTGASFEINSVFKFPLLSETELNKTGSFGNTLRNIRQNPLQGRTIESIINGNDIPETQRNAFSGATGGSWTNYQTSIPIDNRGFSDWLYTPVNWGGGGQVRPIVYHFTGIKEIGGFGDNSGIVAMPRSNESEAAVRPVVTAGTAEYPEHYAVQDWYLDEGLTQRWDDFGNSFPPGLTLYALDNIAFDHASAHRTLATSSFGLILVAGEFDITSSLNVNRAVTYDGIRLHGQEEAMPSVIRRHHINSSGEFFFHFVVNNTLTLAENCNITLTRTDDGILHNRNAGGVYIPYQGTFIMNGGKITDNSIGVNMGRDGSGMLIDTGEGTFIMNGGEISHNRNRGVTVINGGTFTMNGGAISHNTNSTGNGAGAGVSVRGTRTGNTPSIFNMNGGVISNNIASHGYGGGVALNTGAVFNMHRGVIEENVARLRGGGVSMYITGSETQSVVFNMYDEAEIRANRLSAAGSTNTFYGMGVYMDVSSTVGYTSVGAVFNMYGGTISDHKFTQGNYDADVYGCGVAILAASNSREAKFIMHEGAVISGNTGADIGGGVYFQSTGINDETTPSFSMLGGEIKENSASQSGAGVAVLGGGVNSFSGDVRFTMGAGASITDNIITGTGATNGGGGVYVRAATSNSSAIFTMNGGIISGNSSNSNGGGVYVHTVHTVLNSKKAEFIMNDGRISGNSAGGHGGGVSISANAAFVMNDGVIGGTKADGSAYGNTTRTGGGVMVGGAYNGSIRFTMISGSITHNEAQTDGGGIYTPDYSSLDIRGGTGGAVFSDNLAGAGAFDFGIYNWGQDINLAAYNSSVGAAVTGNPMHVKWSLTGNGLEAWGNSVPGTHLLNNYDVNFNREIKMTFVMNDGTGDNGNGSIVGVIEIGTAHGGRFLGMDVNDSEIALFNGFVLSNPDAPLPDMPPGLNPPTMPQSPTRDNHDFIGWSTVKVDTGLEYLFSIDTPLMHGNTIIYAQWSRQPSYAIPNAIDFGTHPIERSGWALMENGIGSSHAPGDAVIIVQNAEHLTNWAIIVSASAYDGNDRMASSMYLGYGDGAKAIHNSAMEAYAYDPGGSGQWVNGEYVITWENLYGEGLSVRKSADFELGEHTTVLTWDIMHDRPGG